MDQAGKTEVEDIHQPNAENRTPKTFEKHMGRGWDSERSTKTIFATPPPSATINVQHSRNQWLGPGLGRQPVISRIMQLVNRFMALINRTMLARANQNTIGVSE